MSFRLPILMAVMLACASARAETPHKILVLPFENATPSPAFDVIGEGAADVLMACLSRHDALIEIVDRTALEAIIDEQGLRWQGLLHDERLRTHLAVSGAGYLFHGVLAQAPEGVLISGALYDAQTTQLLHAAEAAGPLSKLDALLCEKIAVEVAKRLGSDVETRPVIERDPAPKRTQLLIRGLGYYYNKEYAKAFPAFMRLLREDPGNAEARYWLALSFHEAGLNEFAKQQIKKFLQDFPSNKKSDRARALLLDLEGVVEK